MPAEFRVLAISHPLRHPAFDNHSIFNAPPVFDYPAVVVDPAALQATALEVATATAEHATHGGTPVANGETTATHAGLADLLRRRRDEFERALEGGAIVVVFLHPQATTPQVSTFTGLDRYFFLPAPLGLGWDHELIRGGEGSTLAITDPGHPFTGALDVLRSDLLFRAYFNDRAPGFASRAHVLARSPGGAPVAAEVHVGAGRIVFLPAPRQHGGSLSPALAAAILEAARSALGQAGGAPPMWLTEIAVAGLPERETAVERAASALREAQSALGTAERERHDLAMLRDLLWLETGPALARAAERALAHLGFATIEDGRVRTGESTEGELLVEAAGSDHPVGMAPHYAIRARLDQLIATEKRAARGLVVANGQRNLAPDARTEEFDESLRIAAEASRYALLLAPDLFVAAEAARAGALDPERLARLRNRLLATDGLVELDDLLDPPPSAS